MSAQDPTEEVKLVLKVNQYAFKHNLDINKREDVVKILKAIDPDFKEEKVDPIMIALKATSVRIRSDLEKRNKIN